MVAVSWYHDGCHNGSNVECRPLEHELVHKSLGGEVFVASFSHFLLDWNSPGVCFWIRVISIVVCLD